MNEAILHPDVQYFIHEQLNTEITRLILKGSPFKYVTIQELAGQIEAKKKCKNKLSTWFEYQNIYYPDKVNIEQTSSEKTAAYKSTLYSGKRMIDITGGFGVDSYYFSKQFDEVIHCEINTELSEMVRHNFDVLNVSNVKTISENGFNYLKKTNEDFDLIYIDPSRRDDSKGKVFLLKDCLPYIPPKIDFFFTKTTQILLKLSPMLDITSTLKEIKYVKEIHVVSVANEVKELLFLLEKNYDKDVSIKTVNLLKKGSQTFDFIIGNQQGANYALPKKYLYEPNAAILKSGGFSEISKHFTIDKLHKHTHLYSSEEKIAFPGRIFKILKVIPYHKKRFSKEIDTKKANITIRNFPKTVAQLRKETKLKDGGDLFLFFTTNCNNKHIVIFCQKC